MTHPGQLIAEKLKKRGWSQCRLASEIGMKKSQLNEIIKGKRPIGVKLADDLERLFRVSAESLLKKQAIYNLKKYRNEPTNN